MQQGGFISRNDGWLIATASAQYMPRFDLNREIVDKAERFGCDFGLFMIKLQSGCIGRLR